MENNNRNRQSRSGNNEQWNERPYRLNQGDRSGNSNRGSSGNQYDRDRFNSNNQDSAYGNNDENWRTERINDWNDDDQRYSKSNNVDNWRDSQSNNDDRRFNGGSSGRGNPYPNRGEDHDFLTTSYGRSDDDNHRDNERSSRYSRDNDRSWFDKTADEVSSWFGDDEAERRRRMDKAESGKHRGKGPKGYKRSDERIQDDINDRLSDDHFVDATDIDVKVEKGEVTLTGTIDSKQAKRRAEDIAEAISGVTDVQNNLKVVKSDMHNTYDAGASGIGTAQNSGYR